MKIKNNPSEMSYPVFSLYSSEVSKNEILVHLVQILLLEVSFLSERVSPVIFMKEKTESPLGCILCSLVCTHECRQKHVDHVFLFSAPFTNGAGKGINGHSVFPI